MSDNKHTCGRAIGHIGLIYNVLRMYQANVITTYLPPPPLHSQGPQVLWQQNDLQHMIIYINKY